MAKLGFVRERLVEAVGKENAKRQYHLLANRFQKRLVG